MRGPTTKAYLLPCFTEDTCLTWWRKHLLPARVGLPSLFLRLDCGAGRRRAVQPAAAGCVRAHALCEHCCGPAPRAGGEEEGEMDTESIINHLLEQPGRDIIVR